MARTCAGCHLEIPPPPASKWHSEACRKRASRRAGAILPPGSDAPDTHPDGPDAPGTYAAALVELEQAGRLDTTLGRACLVLARRIDANADTGSALATAVRQLEATMAAATKGAHVERTALDELRARRDAKRGA